MQSQKQFIHNSNATSHWCGHCIGKYQLKATPCEFASQIALGVARPLQQGEFQLNKFTFYPAENVSVERYLRGGVKFVDSIPRTLSGKILRRILREM